MSVLLDCNCNACFIERCQSVLDDPELQLIWFALRRCGRRKMVLFIIKALQIQENGGIARADGRGYRTTGGIFAKLVKDYLKNRMYY